MYLQACRMLPQLLGQFPRKRRSVCQTLLFATVLVKCQISDIPADLLRQIHGLQHKAEQVFRVRASLLASGSHVHVRLEVDGLLVGPENEREGAMEPGDSDDVQLALRLILQAMQLREAIWGTAILRHALAPEEAAHLQRRFTDILPSVTKKTANVLQRARRANLRDVRPHEGCKRTSGRRFFRSSSARGGRGLQSIDDSRGRKLSPNRVQVHVYGGRGN
mmetsp:Transcript_70513/g.229295  ORF Transcript_70513/g.229295 Transcript_70513/m.229295 type:complete len:220 (+) Transcript_70513:341-1000(+)